MRACTTPSYVFSLFTAHESSGRPLSFADKMGSAASREEAPQDPLFSSHLPPSALFHIRSEGYKSNRNTTKGQVQRIPIGQGGIAMPTADEAMNFLVGNHGFAMDRGSQSEKNNRPTG